MYDLIGEQLKRSREHDYTISTVAETRPSGEGHRPAVAVERSARRADIREMEKTVTVSEDFDSEDERIDLLFDTHVFLRWMAAPQELAPAVVVPIERRPAEIAFSFIRVWEITTKSPLGGRGAFRCVRAGQALRQRARNIDRGCGNIPR